MIRVPLFLSFLLFAIPSAQAGEPKLALKGLDPVALIDGKEVKGLPAHSATRNRFTYRFASAENLAAFEKDPEQFSIRYGGACAKMGSLSGIGNPDRFHVYDRKIYIFASDQCLAAFKKAPEKYLDRGDPVPTGSDSQKALGKKLLDRVAEGFGGAEAVDKINTLQWQYSLAYKNGDQTSMGKREWIVRHPDAIARVDSWGKSKFKMAVTPQASIYVEPKSTWSMEKCEQDALWRDLLHEPLVVARLRNQPGLVAVAIDPLTIQSEPMEQVRVGYRGTTVTLVIDPQTGRVWQVRFRGRAATGDEEFTHTYADFKKVEELVMPHSIKLFVDGKEVASPKVTLAELKVNAEIPATVFSTTQ